MRTRWQRGALVGGLVASAGGAAAQTRAPTPLRQAEGPAPQVRRLSIEDASRNDRWLGLGVRDVRWAPDGSVVYFRWHRSPRSGDLPDADPWFRADSSGTWAEEVPAAEAGLIPADNVVWDRATRRAAWTSGSSLLVYDPAERPAVRRPVTLNGPMGQPRFADADQALLVEVGEALYRYDLISGGLSLLAHRVTAAEVAETDAQRRLAAQQRELLPSIRELDRIRAERAELARGVPGRARSIPIAARTAVDQLQRSPDGRWYTFRATTRDVRRPVTKYLAYVTGSGYSEVRDARSKTGEPRDVAKLGIVPSDPAIPDDSLAIRWVSLPEAGDQATVPHGPYWNGSGTRAMVQFVGEHARDWWLAELDVSTGRVWVVAHDHEPRGWIGGPPVQSNYRGPALFEWVDDDRYVYASERSGWSHLYLGGVEAVRPLTEGDWEVRGAALSPDRRRWLLQTSRGHPADDRLEALPATGGRLEVVSDGVGRASGAWSPNGERLAVVHSTTARLPDLFVGPLAPRSGEASGRRRVTVSGTDAFRRTRLVDPEIVSFPHPDGRPVWAALYRPARMNPERAAVIHVHGGGYRQFAHRGWSVYGWGLHLGFLHYLLEAGYPVLDFDYRGGAGFGKAYRTGVTGAMGWKDVDGAVAAARYLVRTLGVDSTRIGMYGVSYGGFMTLMSQFRHPGVFAAGISRAPVTDWAHYSDEWTSRILGLPQRDTAAYRRSSPIYFAEGLRDRLLIEHGLVDDNVHFQDAARLVQRLIELGKDFEVMYYPAEPHTVETEASRLDQSKRAIRFFDRYLRGRGAPSAR
ncbi:MAG: S9 family peptidase [Gemmatimonadetes bacterium]|nr:S9 family peptidase [Gemmatimonadota bacterium]